MIKLKEIAFISAFVAILLIGSNALAAELPPSINSVNSYDGKNVAYIITKDAKQAIVLNGVQSDLYDAIDPAFMFSPDSKKLVYKAKQDGKWFLVINGEKSSVGYDEINPFAFSQEKPESKTFAYSAKVALKYYVYFNSQEFGPYDDLASGFPATDNSPNHFAYKVSLGGKWFYIVNGKEISKYDDVSMEMFNDSGKFAFVATKNNKKIMVIDSKESKPYAEIQTVGKGVNGDNNFYYTVKLDNGKYQLMSSVKEASRAYDGINGYDFSTYKKIKWMSAKAKDKAFYVINGKDQKAYDGISPFLYISDDESQYVYFGLIGKKFVTVVNGKEIKN
ncbi:MAG: hypothetical protein NT091_01865 [Candidatus Falkowbacteria bacterium]|nr:hypothetical protein [Candidatus Falkowbacteria bacterium]